MALQTINDMIEDLIDREGGPVDHPSDRGGPTCFGITLRTLRAYHHDQSLTKEDVFSLTKLEAKEIYLNIYYTKPNIHSIHAHDRNLATITFDAGVHSGPPRAIKWMQRAIGTKPDGIIGPNTCKAVEHSSRQQLRQIRRDSIRYRLSFLARLVQKDPSQQDFAAGWMVRISYMMQYI